MAERKTIDKAQIRRQVLSLRNALPEIYRIKHSRIIVRRLISTDLYIKSHTLLLYAAIGSEVATNEIFLKAVSDKKQIYYPKVRGERMEFFRVHGIDELQPGFFGVPEPTHNSQPYDIINFAAAPVLLVMPGVAFDNERNRLGYGKGFYDRFLGGICLDTDPDKSLISTVALAFDCQIIDKIPAAEHDIKPDFVFSTDLILGHSTRTIFLPQ